MPQQVIIAEMTGWELKEPTNNIDPVTGEKMTMLEAIRADEMYDDGLYMVGAQSVSLAMRGAPYLSQGAVEHNRKLSREEGSDPNEHIYAVVSLRPTEAQYKATVVKRLMSHIGAHSSIFPAI